MKILGYILGAIILTPVAAVIAILLSLTLIGGWTALVIELLWHVLIAIVLIYAAVKVIKKITK